MTRNQKTTLGNAANTQEGVESANAMFDEQGTAVGWTQAAERLLGYAAREVVGRSAAMLLPSPAEASGIAEFIDHCRARNGWSGTAVLLHRDGRLLNVSLRISKLWGQGGAVRWLVSVTEVGKLSWAAAKGSVRESLISRAPIGVVVRDTRLRCTWVNDTMEMLDGVPRHRRLGRRFTGALPDSEAAGREAVTRQVMRSRAAGIHEYQTRLPTSPAGEHTVTAFYSCLEGADGRVVGVCAVSVDATESRRARERLAILSERSTRLGSTQDAMRTSQELADLAVPLFADFVAVDLEQSVPFRAGAADGTVPMGHGLPVLRRAGLASIREGVPESPWARGEVIPVPASSPLADTLRTRRPYLEPVLDAAPGRWTDHDPTRARKISENNMHSVMVVPICVQSDMLGVALFVRTEDPAPFQETDLLLAEELVSRAALSLDSARQHARERGAALELQRGLLPQGVRGGAAVEVASRYLPADTGLGVGGDWFDVIELSGARVALVVGDVVGHGIDAAVTMGRLRTAVHTLADMELPPDELLTHLDDTVQRLAEEYAQPPSLMGATCLYAVYDPSTGRCTMARAGHPPPAVIDPHGQVTFPDLPAGVPLGFGVDAPFEAVELEVPEGSLLALYTDGLIETRDHDIDDGMRRLGTALAQPGRSLEDLCARAMDIVPGRAPADDVTLLLVRTHSLSPAKVASWTLPGDPTAARSARHLAALQLAEWGLGDLEDPTKLIVSELVANAARHGSGPIGLRLIQHKVLTCEVSDAGVSCPRLRRSGSGDESGRGLFLVAQMSRRWGSRATPSGKVVWAEEDLDAAGLAGRHAGRA
ncbi:SpoIIE family protein phosphatase [Actinacidiphila sp. bgisy160]|uniref:SpoIIE family protein phosphatase n=1 Tax=Actinacidiphila sp. bgisy160 TaxID=3413796 RepID=UPI003D724E33